MSRDYAFEAAHSAWEMRELDRYLDEQEEDEDTSKPAVYDPKTKMYRSGNTGRFLFKKTMWN